MKYTYVTLHISVLSPAISRLGIMFCGHSSVRVCVRAW